MGPILRFDGMVPCCLVAPDKQPGVNPVWIGEIFQQLLAKLVIADVGNQAKLAC